MNEEKEPSLLDKPISCIIEAERDVIVKSCTHEDGTSYNMVEFNATPAELLCQMDCSTIVGYLKTNGYLDSDGNENGITTTTQLRAFTRRKHWWSLRKSQFQSVWVIKRRGDNVEKRSCFEFDNLLQALRFAIYNEDNEVKLMGYNNMLDNIDWI